MEKKRRCGRVGNRGRFSRLATEEGRRTQDDVHFEVNAAKFSVRGSKAWIGGLELRCFCDNVVDGIVC